VKFANRRLLIGCSLRHLYCVDADSGAMQWTRKFPTTYSVISMMPALIGNGVFMTAPHGRGGRYFDLEAPEDAKAPVTPKDGWSTRLDTLQGCVVQSGGKLIGSFYGGRKGWAAVDSKTGAVLYDTDAYVKGSPLLAEDRIYALCEDGWMVLLEAGEKEFHERGKFRFAKAERDAWAHPVIHEGRLYLRYHENLTCYDIRRAGK
jgi:outer membrane protein assembly factor BamB